MNTLSRGQRAAINTEYVLLMVLGALALILGLQVLNTAMLNKHIEVAEGLNRLRAPQVAGSFVAGAATDNGDGTYTIPWSGGVAPYVVEGATDTDGDDSNTSATVELPTIGDNEITIRDASGDVVVVSARRTANIIAVTTVGVLGGDGTAWGDAYTLTTADPSTAALSAAPRVASDGSIVYRINDNATLSVYDTATNTLQSKSLPAGITTTSHIVATEGVLYFYGSDGRYYTSTDGGTSWTARGLLAGAAQTDLVDGATGYAVTGASGIYRIHKTTNSGATWSEIGNTAASSGPASASAFKTITSFGNHIWMVAHGNEAVFSHDGGVSWTKVYQPNTNPASLLALDEQTVICAGGNLLSGYVMRSADGGTSWTTTYTTSTGGLKSLLAVDNANLFACGTNGLIIKSTDGGVTWQQMSVSLSDAVLGLALP